MNIKQQVAEYAVNHFIRSGMVVGLGVGSTAIFAVRHLAHLLQTGALTEIVAIPCGSGTAQEAEALGIPLTTLEAHPRVDVTIDGADEVDPHKNLIKGGGGALLREKIVAQASQQEIIVVDRSKLVPVLGTGWALPVEVVPFGYGATAAYLESLGATPVLRRDSSGEIFITDGGHYILDCQFGLIHDPATLAAQLKARTGIVEHGLFVGLASKIIVGDAEGIREIV